MIRWNLKTPSSPEGVLIATDQTQEWLLPWWWHHYSQFNSLPVTVVDFGMSPEAREWCQTRATVVRLEVADIFVTEKTEIDPKQAEEWENLYGKQFWSQRSGWFKKPLACLLSPYQKSIWVDLDCEIRYSLKPLLSYPSLAIAKDIDPHLYNSGVIVFEYGLPLIEAWAEAAFDSNHLYAGDQDILSKLLDSHPFHELPQIYNWSRCYGENPEAVIYHWHGRHGKTVIAHRLSEGLNV